MTHYPAFASGLAVAIALCSAAAAQSPPLPTPMVEEVMVKTTLLTLNDANITGNYDVLYAKMSKPFREKLTADALKQGFKTFAGKHIDVIAAMPIVVTSDAAIGYNGALMLRGYFNTTPSRLTYQLDFLVSEGEWKPVVIDVRIKSQSTSDAGQGELLARAAADVAGAAGGGRP